MADWIRQALPQHIKNAAAACDLLPFEKDLLRHDRHPVRLNCGTPARPRLPRPAWPLGETTKSIRPSKPLAKPASCSMSRAM